MQQNPNPNSMVSFLQPTNHSYNPNPYPYQTATVNPHNVMYQNHNRPPGTDPLYAPPPLTVPYAQNPASYEPQQVAASAAATYYQQDPNAVAYYQNPNAASIYPDPNTVSYYQDPNATWTAALAQLGATSYAPGVTSTIPAVQPQKIYTRKKFPKVKKTRVVQSAWCEVCKLDCNSKGVLDQHKLGRKHMKKLEKLRVKIKAVPPPSVPNAPPPVVIVPAPVPVSTSAPINNPAIGPAENPGKLKLSSSQRARKKAADARKEDLETKKRRVVAGGVSVGDVRACNICNVVCNSDTVFNFHIRGQKHAAMVKKYVSGMSVAPAM